MNKKLIKKQDKKLFFTITSLIFFLFFVLLLIKLISGSFNRSFNNNWEQYIDSNNNSSLDYLDRINLSSGYLMREIKKDGFFNYKYYLVDKSYPKSDNIVRQAGAGYSLAEYYLLTGDKDAKDSLERVIRAYKRSSINTGDYNSKMLTVDGKISKTKTGATALALLTELLYYKKSKNNQFLKIRNQWLNGILNSYIENKGFRKSLIDNTETPFYNGEAWLVLSWYNRVFPNNMKVKNILSKLDSYFINKYSNEWVSAFYQWGAMAAYNRYILTKDDKFKEFIINQSLIYNRRKTPLSGSIGGACAGMEGMGTSVLLLAKYDEKQAYMEEYKILKGRYLKELERIEKSQIDNSTEVLKYKDTFIILDNLENKMGGFLNYGRNIKLKKNLKQFKIRINLVQHCLSAFIKGYQFKNKD